MKGWPIIVTGSAAPPAQTWGSQFFELRVIAIAIQPDRPYIRLPTSDKQKQRHRRAEIRSTRVRRERPMRAHGKGTSRESGRIRRIPQTHQCSERNPRISAIEGKLQCAGGKRGLAGE